MPNQRFRQASDLHQTHQRRWPLFLLLTLTTLLSLVAWYAFDRQNANDSLMDLTNLVGPTTDSLLHHQGLTACVTAMGTPGNPICFHAGRMPLPTLTVALGVSLFGDHFLPVALFKLLLFLLPIELAIVLVWRKVLADRPRSLLVALLLLAPFGMTPFLADVVNLQVEEGYSYSFLALAVAILFFAFDTPGAAKPAHSKPRTGLLLAALFGLSIDAIYLAKSSMLPAAFVLTLAFLCRERRTLPRLLVLLLVASAPLGWALHQHHASGRYSLGTSIDGINLHKGNNRFFAEHYPPPPGETLDGYDRLLNLGQSFPDEWAFNDFHQHAAFDYIRTHPHQDLTGELRKLYVIFITTRKLGSSESHGLMLKVETLSILLLRVFLWAAMLFSIYGLFWKKAWRVQGAIFLAVVAACVLPYMLGFAYVRHISILIYPSVLLLCAVIHGARPYISSAHP